MKKHGYLLIAFVTLLTACSKKSDNFDSAAQAVTDDAAIQAYISTNKLTGVVKDPSGLYYQIINKGSGTTPTLTSTISVNYNGKLLDGTVFDQTTTTTGSRSFVLSQVVLGWQVGIPLINPGGRILLLCPSALGYGNSSPSSSIPVNSVLIFTIDLISVKL